MENLDDFWNEIGIADTAEIENEPKIKINYLPSKSKKIIYITKSGAFIKFDMLSDSRLIKKIENYFTLKTKIITGAFKQLKCCKLDKVKNRIIVPRFGVFELLNKKYQLNDYKTVSQILPGDLPEIPFEWTGTLNNNQKIISDHIMRVNFAPGRVTVGSSGVILNLEAGQGKSYIAAHLISIIGKKTAIIMHSTSLLEQWAKVLRICFGADVSIGYYYGKKKIAGDIMLMIIDSATSDVFKMPDGDMSSLQFYNQFGFIIYDECHTYANKYSQKALKVAQAPYMLGLSATPDEHCLGFDKSVWWELGPVLNAKTLPGYESKSEDFKAVVHRVMYYGPKKYTIQITNEFTEMTSISETINMICTDAVRSNIVVDCISKGLELGLYMFVFADRREYLAELRQILSDRYNVDGEIIDNDKDFVRIVGGAENDALEKAELKSKVIFTTYQYMGTGKSIIKMNGLVLATPRKSKMKQYINRIFRLGSDASITRHIWDVCDMKLKLCNQWNTRNRYFKEKGYEIESEKINYNDYELPNAEDLEETEDTICEFKSKEPDLKNINIIVSNMMARLIKK